MSESTPYPPGDGPAPSTVTGDARVDDVVAGLDGLAGRELPDQLASFVEMHAALTAVLDDGGPAAGPTAG